MLGGIAKLFIAKSSDVNTRGFSSNGSRFGFSLKNGVDWTEVDIMRDTAIDSGKLDTGNEFEVSANVFSINTNLNGFIGKRVVLRYYTPDNEIRIIGIDQPGFFNSSFDSGVKPGDNVGMIYKITGLSKSISEILKPYTPPAPPIEESPLKLHFRADDVVVTGNEISQTNDKTGNGYNGTIPVGFNNPLLVSNVLNGHAIIDFILNSGLIVNSNYFGSTSLWGGGVNSLNRSDECVVSFVAKHNDLASATIRVFNNQNMEFDLYQYNSINYLRISNRGNITVFQGQANSFDNNFHIWTIVNSSTISKIYKDGLLIKSDSNFTYSEKFGSIIINNKTSGNTGKMQMAEFRIYDRILSDLELTTLHNQLKTYYNL